MINENGINQVDIVKALNQMKCKSTDKDQIFG